MDSKIVSIKIPKGTLININNQIHKLTKSIRAVREGRYVILTDEVIETDSIVVDRCNMENAVVQENFNKNNQIIKIEKDEPNLHELAMRIFEFSSDDEIDKDLKKVSSEYLKCLFRNAIKEISDNDYHVVTEDDFENKPNMRLNEHGQLEKIDIDKIPSENLNEKLKK